MRKIHSVQKLLSMGVGVAPIFFQLANFTTEKRYYYYNFLLLMLIKADLKGYLGNHLKIGSGCKI